MSNSQFKILSLDGGGIKGIIPCAIFVAIEEKTNNAISELFDVIAGTSTGGIIALGLSKPDENNNNAFRAKDMFDLYVNNGKDIFLKRQEDLWSKIGSIFNKTKAIVPLNYEIEHFEKLLKEKFRDTPLSEALVDLLITTYDLNEGNPFYFSSRLAKAASKEDILMRDIARSTSAAPTFFEPSLLRYNDKEEMAFVDGGVFANNPSILAYGEAKEIWKKISRLDVPDNIQKDAKGTYAVVEPDDKDLPFYMLSLGCGHSRSEIDFSKAKNWRTIEWVQPLLTDIFMRSVEQSTDYTMKHLMPPYKNGDYRYQRMDMELPSTLMQMDNVSPENINRLVDFALDFVKKEDAQIEKICEIIG
ncbi:MAG: patatin-like phospholipase family protein [Ferruginibacter sp.]